MKRQTNHRALDEAIARKQQLGRIHLAKKQLGLDDDTYRALLECVTGLTSSKDMTHEQRNLVLAEFARLGFKWERSASRARAFKGRPKNVADVPMLRKVEALLADAKRPWAYAHAMAERMHQVKRVEWLNPHQLHGLVSALQVDANRHHKGKR
jgi:phage gp16-like protein